MRDFDWLSSIHSRQSENHHIDNYTHFSWGEGGKYTGYFHFSTSNTHYPTLPPHQPSLSTCNSLSMKIVTIFVHHIKPVPDNLKLYYVNLVYNFNLNAHYHIYKSWTFMISTASLTVASSKAVASLATVHVPSPLVTSAFSRRCVGLPPHVKKALVPRVNKYLCNNIIIVSTKLHPVNRVKK